MVIFVSKEILEIITKRQIPHRKGSCEQIIHKRRNAAVTKHSERPLWLIIGHRKQNIEIPGLAVKLDTVFNIHEAHPVEPTWHENVWTAARSSIFTIKSH